MATHQLGLVRGLMGTRNEGQLGPVQDERAFKIMALLMACAAEKDLDKGSRLHAHIQDHNFLEKNIYLGNSLINMYCKCGTLDKAQRVLEELPSRDVVTWNAVIAGYTLQGKGKEALKLFDNMQQEGHSPNKVTFICALKACASTRAAAKGKEIHDMIVSLGMLEKYVILGSSLVDMYVKCGAVTKAQRVLEELSVRNVVTWSALIAGYAQHGQGEEALKFFDSMLYEGIYPNEITFTCALKACGSIGAAAKGEEIHEKIVSLGMLEENVMLGSALVDMYAKCGALTKAQEVLEGLPVRNVASWNALIAGYAEQGQGEEALKCFKNVLLEGYSPNEISFTCALKACGSIGAAAKGEEIHDKVLSLGLLEKDTMLGNTLVDMYAKCGTLAKAQQVLQELPVQDVVTWSALIAGYAQQGQSVEAIKCFGSMQSRGVMPNSTTLISVINACNHSGLVDEAEALFSGMSTEYGIQPDVGHYCCMADLFSRVGKFNKALSLIGKMPSDKYFPVWVALLTACRKWADMKLGRLAYERAFQLDKSNVFVYLVMADIYMAADMQEDADKIEGTRVANKAWKPGYCW